METTYVIHYGEVALKGKNRPDFMRAVRHSIARSLAAVGPARLELVDGRFLATVDGDPDDVGRSLARVFGVVWFARASVLGKGYEEARGAVMAAARSSAAQTFMIDARRTDKSSPPSSMELAKMLGAEVVAGTGKKVDLSDPGLRIHVDVLRDRTLVYTGRERGAGGLPVGTGGRAMHLFSGGIDSPVAAWLMMKRGTVPVYVHFYLAPSPEVAASSKVAKLVEVLTAYSHRSTLVLVPFAGYQLATAGSPSGVEPSLFRRFMRLTAEALAPGFGATAISTGDSLAQAASQTIWNMRAIDAGSSLPTLRPLLGYDKEEVVQLARRIGTYELSIEDYKDCCAIVTRHPRTRVGEQDVSRLSAEYDFPRLVAETIRDSTVATYSAASKRLTVASMADFRMRHEGGPAAERSPDSLMEEAPSGAEGQKL